MNMDFKKYWIFFIKLVDEQMRGITVPGLAAGVAVCFIAVHAGCFIYSAKKKKTIRMTKKISIWLTASYALFIIMITFLNRDAGSRSGINIYPYFGSFFGSYYEMRQMGYNILNVILFIPWGAVLTLLCMDTKPLKRFIFVTLYCFLTTFMIETGQYITQRGYSDITDIITNITGGILGCLLMTAIIAGCNKLRQTLSKKQDDSKVA